MKTKLFMLIIIMIIAGCESKFTDLSKNEKKAVVTENIKSYFDKNKNKVEIQNFQFLLKQSNKLKPCIVKPFENIKVLIRDSIYASNSLNLFSSYEYLNEDSEYGEIDAYGIEFDIDTTGNIKSISSYISFTKWSDDKIGSRESLDDTFKNYKEGQVFNIKNKYLNPDLLKKLNEFYKTEMKPKQLKNKSKCN